MWLSVSPRDLSAELCFAAMFGLCACAAVRCARALWCVCGSVGATGGEGGLMPGTREVSPYVSAKRVHVLGFWDV
jgi:hypothetical protein